MVKLAKTAGFCYGVDRAVKLAETEAEKGGEIYTLGPIIHNPYVVEDLKKKGVMVVDSAENAKEGVKIVAFCNKTLTSAKEKIIELSEFDANEQSEE